VLALNPAEWPMTPGDMVVDVDSGQQWLTVEVDLLNNNADPEIDYIRAVAHIRAGVNTAP
jgi:hypothetical protein